MKLLTATVRDNCDISLHGDAHEGNALTSRSGLESVIAWIAAKSNRYFVNMGDELEGITTDDKRYQADTTTEPIPMRQTRAVIERYTSIRKRGLAWLGGNHNFTLHRFGNLTEHIAQELGIPYGTWSCKLLLRDGRGPIAKLYLTHGFRGTITSNAKDFEQREANMKASLKMRLVNKASDCIVMSMGHSHKLMVVEPAQRLILTDDGRQLIQHYLGPGNGLDDYIEPDRRWYCNTGSFLRTFALEMDGYAERAGYDPVELGHVVVEIRDRAVVACRKVVVE